MKLTEERDEAVERIGREAVGLLAVVAPSPGTGRGEALAAVALRRLAVLLDAELRASDADGDLLLLYARAVAEAWLTGHAALLLGEDGERLLERRRRLVEAMADPRSPAPPGDVGPDVAPVTLLDLASELDEHVYGRSDRPKAFERHLRSFFEEVDVRGADGTAAMLDAYLERSTDGAATGRERADVLRVSLWVVLFLSRYYFDAVGDTERANQAYGLFRRLREATAGLYQERSRA